MAWFITVVSILASCGKLLYPQLESIGSSPPDVVFVLEKCAVRSTLLYFEYGWNSVELLAATNTNTILYFGWDEIHENKYIHVESEFCYSQTKQETIE